MRHQFGYDGRAFAVTSFESHHQDPKNTKNFAISLFTSASSSFFVRLAASWSLLKPGGVIGRALILGLASLLGLALHPTGRAEQNPAVKIQTIEGGLPSGARYLMQIPSNWNGAVLLFNHGFTFGPDNPPRNGPHTGNQTLLNRGYAMIGSSYSETGWAVEAAIRDQLNTLDEYEKRFGRARRTVVWGESMGGLVTLELIEQHAARFDGAMPICGSVCGGVGMMNQALDATFALKTLVDPASSIRITRIADMQPAPVTKGDPRSMLDEPTETSALLGKASATPQGRARALLAAVLGQVSFWTSPGQPQPDAEPDDTMLETIQTRVIEAFPMGAFFPRRSQEIRAGGNASWNTNVDYRVQLEKSGQRRLVERAYRRADLDLNRDLDVLASAPRIAADPRAVDFMMNNYVPSGQITRPVLSLHTMSDPLTPGNYEAAYAQYVASSGKGELLKTVFTRYPGHCTFTQPQVAAAIEALDHRITSGRWEKATVQELNRVAESIGSAKDPLYANRTASSIGGTKDALFVEYNPAAMLRPCSKNHCEEKQ